MSQSSAASKKRLDDKNLKLIRELAALPSNRNCVECGQRGPTYVDMMTCSFCCSTCSGILRGLNPPHRIKSISMAVFSAEEIEKLRAGGNEESNKIWLGMYTGAAEKNFATKEERTKFIMDKYERKVWYVSTEEVERQRQLFEKANQAKSDHLPSPPKNNMDDFFSASSSLTSHSSPFEPAFSSSKASNVPIPPSNSRWNGKNDLGEAFSPPTFMAPPPPQPVPAQQKLINPFASPPVMGRSEGLAFSASAQPTPFTQSLASNNENLFANFDEKFGGAFGRPNGAEHHMKSSATLGAFQTSHPESSLTKSVTLSTPFSSDPFASLGSPAQFANRTTAQSGAVHTQTMTTNQHQNTSNLSSVPPKESVAPQAGGDKYSALAELDQLFHSVSVSGEAKAGPRPAWVPSGFSAPAPSDTTAFNNGLTKSSSTLGGNSQQLPKVDHLCNPFHTIPSTSDSFKTLAPSTDPFCALPPPSNPFSGIPAPSDPFSGMPAPSDPFSSLTPASDPFQSFSANTAPNLSLLNSQSSGFGSATTEMAHAKLVSPETANPFTNSPSQIFSDAPLGNPQNGRPQNDFGTAFGEDSATSNPFWNPFSK